MAEQPAPPRTVSTSSLESLRDEPLRGPAVFPGLRLPRTSSNSSAEGGLMGLARPASSEAAVRRLSSLLVPPLGGALPAAPLSRVPSASAQSSPLLTPLCRGMKLREVVGEAAASSGCPSPSLTLPEHFQRLRAQMEAEVFSLGPSAVGHAGGSAGPASGSAAGGSAGSRRASESPRPSPLVHAVSGAAVAGVVAEPSAVHEVRAAAVTAAGCLVTAAAASVAAAPGHLEAPPPAPASAASLYTGAVDAAHEAAVVGQCAAATAPCEGVEKREGEGEAAPAVYIFGYGSLIWKPDMEHSEAVAGYVRGAVRRFYQASPDHRGTPAYLGRVVTLLLADEEGRPVEAPAEDAGAGAAGCGAAECSAPAAGSSGRRRTSSAAEEGGQEDDCVVHGTAFRLTPSCARETLDRLCQREKAGYSVQRVRVEVQGGAAVCALAFSATPANEFFTGWEDERLTAQVIATAVGSSGTNLFYFLSLLAAMRQRGVTDWHLERLWCLISLGEAAGNYDEARAFAAASLAAGGTVTGGAAPSPVLAPLVPTCAGGGEGKSGAVVVGAAAGGGSAAAGGGCLCLDVDRDLLAAAAQQLAEATLAPDLASLVMPLSEPALQRVLRELALQADNPREAAAE